MGSKKVEEKEEDQKTEAFDGMESVATLELGPKEVEAMNVVRKAIYPI